MESKNPSVPSGNSNGHHKLDNLPDDNIYHSYLFDYLDLDDVLKLKLVSKSFYDKVKSYDIKELSFVDFDLSFDYNEERLKDKWFSTTKSIKLRSRFDISKSSLLNNPPDNFLNLKYLKVNAFQLPFVKAEDLNKFTKLQVLHISRVDTNSNGLLQLPDLKALSILYGDIEFEELGKLIVDAPNLHSLSICVYEETVIDDQVKFIHPLSVKYLKISDYDKNALIFGNLECLEVSCTDGLQSDLLKFKNLKKIKIIPYSRAVNRLKILFRCTLEKNDLEFVLFGVKIKSIDKIDEYGSTNPYKFQMDNYAELEDDLNFINPVQYCNLESFLPTNLPSDLFRKYTNVNGIYINSEVKDEDQFLNFIKGCHDLCGLVIDKSLSQKFYDQLPAITISLSELLILEETNLNFGFALNLPYLSFLAVNQDIQIDEYLKNLKHLYMIEFRIKYDKIEIYKYGRDRYKVGSEFGYTQILNLNESIRWINNFRNEMNQD